MRLLIDGYNVMYTAGVPGRGFGIGKLERGRLGLLKFVAESLEPAELAETVVVFDGRDAPPGLPRQIEYCGMQVRFAPRSLSADDVIEELIQQESAPGRLTVVSSDRRIQQAARRRKAKAIDSQSWYESLCARRRCRAPKPLPESLKPAHPPLEAEVARWLAEFGGEQIVEMLLREEKLRHWGPNKPAQTRPIGPEKASPRTTNATGQAKPSTRRRPSIRQKDVNKPVDLENPFPPGYGEDVPDENS